MLCNSVTAENKIKWLVNSGATDHMVNNLCFFDTCSNLENPINIHVAKFSQTLHASKIGNILIKINKCDKTIDGKIKNVLYVEGLRNNLLSVQKLAECGISVMFKNKKVILTKNNNIVAEGNMISNLYEIEFVLRLEHNANLCNKTSDLNVWHRRLGHLNNKSVIQLSDMAKWVGFIR